MFCIECGAPIDAGAEICPACGAVVVLGRGEKADGFQMDDDDARPLDNSPDPLAFGIANLILWIVPTRHWLACFRRRNGDECQTKEMRQPVPVHRWRCVFAGECDRRSCHWRYERARNRHPAVGSSIGPVLPRCSLLIFFQTPIDGVAREMIYY